MDMEAGSSRSEARAAAGSYDGLHGPLSSPGAGCPRGGPSGGGLDQLGVPLFLAGSGQSKAQAATGREQLGANLSRAGSGQSKAQAATGTGGCGQVGGVPGLGAAGVDGNFGADCMVMGPKPDCPEFDQYFDGQRCVYFSCRIVRAGVRSRSCVRMSRYGYVY